MANGAVQRGGGGSLGQGEATRAAMDEGMNVYEFTPWWLGGEAGAWFGKDDEPDSPPMPAPTFSAEDYWTGNAKAAEDAALRAVGYDPLLYRDLTAEANRREAEALGVANVLDPQVRAAYGAAGAQAQRGAQNVYGAGQRAAGEIAGRSEAAASRAAGYLSGQGMPSTMISGVTGTSGGASFDPTQGRAYGGIAAESLGREASFAAQDLAGRGSGMGRRVTLAEMINSDANRMRGSVESARILAESQARTARSEAAAAAAKQKSDDLLSADTQQMALARAQKLWDDSQELRDLYNDNEDAYNKAVAYAVGQRSRTLLENWWNSVVFYSGEDANVGMLLPPQAGNLEAILAAGGQ